MSYKNYNWDLVAADYNSPFFRNYIWVKGVSQFPQEHGTAALIVSIISKNSNIEYVADFGIWKEIHEDLKVKAQKDSDYFESLIDRANQEGEKFNAWTEKEIYKKDLSKVSGEELADILDKFVDWQGRMYAIGVAVPVLDFDKFAYVESFLNNYLRKNTSKEEYREYYALFTEPPYNSFSQDQEEDLLNIISKYWDKKNWQTDIKEKNIDELKNLQPDFMTDLEFHTARHSWVYYAYNGPHSTEGDFLNFARDHLLRLEHPKNVLKNLSDKRKKLEQRKQEFINKYKPSEKEIKMLNLAGKFVWGKPRRKDYQSKSYFHAKEMQLEIARRLNLSLDQARHTPFDMIRDCLVDNKAVDIKKVNSIIKFHVIAPNQDGNIEVLYGKEADDFYNSLEFSKEEDFSNLKVIHGSTASPGKAKGIVKVINEMSDMQKMEQGDILVSIATNPNIVAAMKKASAIVTDEGGLTCHAAIVSRELETPCVVGTRFASKALKDGDMIEVDADKGIVKKLN